VKLQSPILDHVKFYILLILSFILAENLVVALNRLLPAAVASLLIVFDNLTYPLLIGIVIVLIARLLTLILPELNSATELWIGTPLLAMFVLVHPIIIQVVGSRLDVTWLVFDIVRQGLLIQFLIETLIYLTAVYFVYLIQLRSPVREDRYARYLNYAGDDILTLLFIASITIYLVRSFVIDQFTSITLTIPIKLLLLIFLYFATRPLPEGSGSELKS
jgi:hypothetical protein